MTGLRDFTHMIFESCNLLTWGGVVKKLIGWWRDRPDGLNMEQPTEIPDDNSSEFQSLINVSACERFQRGRDDLEVGGPSSKLGDENVHLFYLLCFVGRAFDVDDDSSIPLHSRDNGLSPARI